MHAPVHYNLHWLLMVINKAQYFAIKDIMHAQLQTDISTIGQKLIRIP